MFEILKHGETKIHFKIKGKSIYKYKFYKIKSDNSQAAKSQDCATPDTSMKLSTLVKVGDLMNFKYKTTSTNFLCACARQNSLPL